MYSSWYIPYIHTLTTSPELGVFLYLRAGLTWVHALVDPPSQDSRAPLVNANNDFDYNSLARGDYDARMMERITGTPRRGRLSSSEVRLDVYVHHSLLIT